MATHMIPAGDYRTHTVISRMFSIREGDTVDGRNARFHQHNLQPAGVGHGLPLVFDRVTPGVPPFRCTVQWMRTVGHMNTTTSWSTLYKRANPDTVGDGNPCAFMFYRSGSIRVRWCFTGGPTDNNCTWDSFRFWYQDPMVRGVYAGNAHPIVEDCAFLYCRDDVIENDTWMPPMTVRRCWFNSMMGISYRSGNVGGVPDTLSDARQRHIWLEDSVWESLWHQSESGFNPNCAFKYNSLSPRINLKNYVIATGWPGRSREATFRSNAWQGNWRGALGKIDDRVGDNLFLYLGDDGFNSIVPTGPFRLVQGAEARQELHRLKRKWIMEHQYFARIWPDYHQIVAGSGIPMAAPTIDPTTPIPGDDPGPDPVNRPPTVPINLRAPLVTATQVDLAWNASTDPDGQAIARYDVFKNNAKLAEAPSTTHSDTAVTASTTYQYQVEAFDPLGLGSGRTAALSVTTPSVNRPPTVPQSLRTVLVTHQQVILAWNASTDPDGQTITRYDIFRDGALIGSPSGLSLTDTNVQPSTSYQYRVEAVDPLGSRSGQSPVLAVTTPAPPVVDQPPTTPTNFRATNVSHLQVRLEWTAATDPDGTVAGYIIRRNGAIIAQPTSLSLVDSAVQPSTSYGYTIQSRDNTNLLSAQTTVLTVTTPAAPDIPNQPPTTPSNLRSTSVTHNRVVLAWNASIDPDGAIARYVLRRNNVTVGQPTAPSFEDTQVEGGTVYVYTVQAVDDDGESSSQSAPLTVTTPTAPSNAPTPPSAVHTLVVEQDRIVLSWSPSVDPDGLPIEKYQIRRGGVIVGEVVAPPFTDPNVAPRTVYLYTIEAIDADGLRSEASATLAVLTPGGAGPGGPGMHETRLVRLEDDQYLIQQQFGRMAEVVRAMRDALQGDL